MVAGIAETERGRLLVFIKIERSIVGLPSGTVGDDAGGSDALRSIPGRCAKPSGAGASESVMVMSGGDST